MSPSLAHDTERHSLLIISSSNPALLGRTFEMPPSDSLTVGRRVENTIVLDEGSISRRHARFELRGGIWWVVDLDSTNGVTVNDEPAGRTPLRCGDVVRVGDTLFKLVCASRLEDVFDDRQIFEISRVDGMTKLLNRRGFCEQLDAEIKRSRASGSPLALALFDLDRFKTINDNFGFLAGDHVLRELASLARSRLRPGDSLARYSGQVFVWLMPGTSLPEATALAEALREEIQAHAFTFEDSSMSLTISVGVALVDTTDPLAAADEKLHQAKSNGRNRVAS